MGLLPTNVRDLWLGSHTYLATDENDSQAFGYGVNYEKWGEISPDGTRTPVEDMRARTSLSSGRNPKGHYRIASLVFTVDYNNGEENETTTLNTASSSNSWNIPWGTHAIPAGKIFKEWKLTTSDSDHVSINRNTLTWDVGANDPNAKLTAVWRNMDRPTINSIVVHKAASANPEDNTDSWADVIVDVPEDSRDTDDPLTLESYNCEGFNSLCIPSAAGNQCTFRLSIAQLRGNDYDAEYQHLSTQLTAYDHYTEINVTGPLGYYRGILPYTTVNYQPGAGAGGTAPSTQKSLTDTPSQTAPLTMAGPDTITRPKHSVFNKWQASHGAINPRAAQVPASIGETDATGCTIISLSAAWTKLATPEITTAKRDAANNQATITGTAKPLHSSDIVRICHPTNTGSRQCQDITPDSTGQDGTALPNNDTSEHPWNITLPIADDQGELTVDATLISKDTAYTGNPEVQSATASATTAGSTGDDNNDGIHDTSGTPSEPNTPNKGETPEAPKTPETRKRTEILNGIGRRRIILPQMAPIQLSRKAGSERPAETDIPEPTP
ncbi:hypothetical protein FHX77_001094 [Bifidobacterium commune]|uniref:Uncharacterized protein n=1 Tax=Bifidobacterium commune TaxID=1505727 RepID=A0A1C4H6U4_9BIFI|nr:hypothetical protein [Bifidobacterium commune]MBB2955668.1 hypothetical protein [Bifidobacterium commune]SCC80463.1 hypothetical protein GA0061077_1210 [Bifidobacterium commune]